MDLMFKVSAAAATGVLGLGLVLAVPSIAEAQATRTWVSGVGDDANPCSRTAPCKTFAGAISKTAVGGFINAIDSGGFGSVTITKSITIDGGAVHAGILAAGGANGININGAGIIVRLRNLSIESPTSSRGANGIVVFSAAEVYVEKCWIGGFNIDAIDFKPAGGGFGFISDTTIADNQGGGIVVNTGRVTVSNLRAESNANGVMVNGGAIATVRDSYAAGGGAGFGAVVSAASVINIENSVSTGNQYGIYVNSGATARVTNSSIFSNTGFGLFNDGASFLVSYGGNSLGGNPTPGAFTSTVAKQ
jgi:hypothetical protein